MKLEEKYCETHGRVYHESDVREFCREQADKLKKALKRMTVATNRHEPARYNSGLDEAEEVVGALWEAGGK